MSHVTYNTNSKIYLQRPNDEQKHVHATDNRRHVDSITIFSFINTCTFELMACFH